MLKTSWKTYVRFVLSKSRIEADLRVYWEGQAGSPQQWVASGDRRPQGCMGGWGR